MEIKNNALFDVLNEFTKHYNIDRLDLFFILKKIIKSELGFINNDIVFYMNEKQKKVHLYKTIDTTQEVEVRITKRNIVRVMKRLYDEIMKKDLKNKIKYIKSYIKDKEVLKAKIIAKKADCFVCQTSVCEAILPFNQININLLDNINIDDEVYLKPLKIKTINKVNVELVLTALSKEIPHYIVKKYIEKENIYHKKIEEDCFFLVTFTKIDELIKHRMNKENLSAYQFSFRLRRG